MNKPSTIRAKAITAVLLASLLASCSGESPESLINSGKEFLAKNDTKAAVIQFKNALQQNPGLSEARFLLGKALLQAGDPQGAEVELRKALELKHAPDQTIPLLAQSMLSLGLAKKVTDEFSNAELTGESGANLKTTLSLAFQAQGNIDAANKALAAALALQPDYGPARIAEARAKAVKQDISGALAIVDDILAKNPTNHEAWLLKGSLVAYKGDPATALEYYNKAAQSKPDFVPAHLAIISSLMQSGKFDEATKQLETLKKFAAKNPQTRFVEAQLAYQRKDYSAVREISQELLKSYPNNPGFLQLAGATEYQLASHSQAEAYLNKALQQAPDLVLARRLLITNYLRIGQPAKAMATLQPVLEKIEKDPGFLALAGEVYLQSGEPKKAEEYFNKASKLDPNDPVKRTSLARAHIAQGNNALATAELEEISGSDKGTIADQALVAYHMRRNELDKALAAVDTLQKKQPENPATYNLRASIEMSRKNTAGARKNLEQALALNPTYMPAVANLAAMDLADNKPADARKRFDDVLAKDPKNVSALLALAKLTAMTGGKPDEVLGFINKAVSANPTETAPRLALIEFYLSSKEPKKAASLAQDALATLPDKPELLNAAATAQYQAGDVNQALATFAKLASVQSASPIPYLRIAEIQIAEKNLDEASKNLRKALEIKQDSVEAQRLLIRINLERGKPQEALSIAREIQKQRPKEVAGFLFEGDIYANDKRLSNAIAAYRSGLKQVPGSSELAIRLHKALVASQNTGDAEKMAIAWLKEHPKDIAFRLYSGDMATASKDYALAAQHYRAALEIQPENAVALNNLAWVSGQLKSPKALEYAEKANRLAPNQPAFMDTQAMLMAEQGDTGGAIVLLTKALEISPQAAAIRLNLARVLISANRKDEARKELDALTKLGDKFPAHAEVERLQKQL